MGRVAAPRRASVLPARAQPLCAGDQSVRPAGHAAPLTESAEPSMGLEFLSLKCLHIWGVHSPGTSEQTNQQTKPSSLQSSVSVRSPHSAFLHCTIRLTVLTKQTCVRNAKPSPLRLPHAPCTLHPGAAGPRCLWGRGGGWNGQSTGRRGAARG